MKWRRSLGVDDDALAMAFLGRLVMEKGLDVFVEAIDILTNARSSIASW
jgi:glycogen synthase